MHGTQPYNKLHSSYGFEDQFQETLFTTFWEDFLNTVVAIQQPVQFSPARNPQRLKFCCKRVQSHCIPAAK